MQFSNKDTINPVWNMISFAPIIHPLWYRKFETNIFGLDLLSII